MAKLPPERQALIWDSKQKLLEIIDRNCSTGKGSIFPTLDFTGSDG